MAKLVWQAFCIEYSNSKLKLMGSFDQIFNLVAPSLTAIAVVYFTYRFGLSQKRFEQKQEYIRKSRETVSNLLLIWSEFLALRNFTNQKESEHKVIFKIPLIAKKVLGLDKRKIKLLKSAYESSLHDFKSINASQYFNLEMSLQNFHSVLDEILIPLNEDEDISLMDKCNIFKPIIDDLHKQLTVIIGKVSENLPKNEQDEIQEVLKKGDELHEDSPESVPKFLVELINQKIPFKEKVTVEEFQAFFTNETVLWILEKVLTPAFGQKLFGSKFSNMIKTLHFMGSDSSIESKNNIAELVKIFELSILKLSLTEEDNQRFINNKPFYYLILGSLEKFIGTLPKKFKEEVVKLNLGITTVDTLFNSFKAELEKQRNTTPPEHTDLL